MDTIRLLESIGKGDAGTAGGKGASLGELMMVGVLVPPGYVILTGAYERFIKDTGVNIEIDAAIAQVVHQQMHTVEYASEIIQAVIMAATIPEDIAEDIYTSFEKLGSKFVAVRSSATAEDSITATWAGQLDTYLNTTRSELLTNVQRCWASLFTPRAIFYRFERNLHSEEISVAVIVQKMVVSEASGVVFSVHPVTEDPNQLIIEAGWGLGEAIVSGQVTPDSYVIAKDSLKILNKKIVTKERGLYQKKGGGNEWRPISKQRQRTQALSDELIIELTKTVLAIEKHYGFPCDIEWALEDGQIYITQSRPITTLDRA